MFGIVLLLLVSSTHGIITPPAPEFVISCPGKKKTDAASITCQDTPLRTQFVIAVKSLQNAGLATDCAINYEDPASDKCDSDGYSCYDNRDCCSSYCDWSASTEGVDHGFCGVPSTTGNEGNGKTSENGLAPGHGYQEQSPDDANPDAGAEPEPLAGNRRSLRLVSSGSLGSLPRRTLIHTANTGNECGSNSECLSYRCQEGHCDDSISDTYAGTGSACDPLGVKILYTIQLEGESDPGDPTFDSDFTMKTTLGVFEEMSFPGKVVIRAITEYCPVVDMDYTTWTTTETWTAGTCSDGTSTTQLTCEAAGTCSNTDFTTKLACENPCQYSSVSKMTINVNIKGINIDNIADDSKPSFGSNDTYIRGAVTFDVFTGGAARFNAR